MTKMDHIGQLMQSIAITLLAVSMIFNSDTNRNQNNNIDHLSAIVERLDAENDALEKRLAEVEKEQKDGQR